MQGFIRIGRMTLEIPVASNIGEQWNPAQLTKTTTITIDSGEQVPHGKQCLCYCIDY